MNDSIFSLWTSMAKMPDEGLFKQRMPIDAPIQIFGIFSHPENAFGIGFSFDRNIQVTLDAFRNLKELTVKLLPDTSFSGKNLLVIQLHTRGMLEVFACMCDNLVSSIREFASEKAAVNEIIGRLHKWKSLFDRSKDEGLTMNEQQGLYGELVYLDKLLKRAIMPKYKCIATWVGMDKEMRDFQGDGWAVEVKSSSANNPMIVTINGARQLDEKFLERLYLYHLSLETSKMNGQTLNEKIDELSAFLSDDFNALNLFNTNLFVAGYSAAQRHLYDNRCYKIRSEHFFSVERDFPRIREEDLISGIIRVDYTIDLASCDDYLLSEGEHFRSISELCHE